LVCPFEVTFRRNFKGENSELIRVLRFEVCAREITKPRRVKVPAALKVSQIMRDTKHNAIDYLQDIIHIFSFLFL
jgi:hypothetical protein